jgi:hypothetical protein
VNGQRARSGTNVPRRGGLKALDPQALPKREILPRVPKSRLADANGEVPLIALARAPVESPKIDCIRLRHKPRPHLTRKSAVLRSCRHEQAKVLRATGEREIMTSILRRAFVTGWKPQFESALEQPAAGPVQRHLERLRRTGSRAQGERLDLGSEWQRRANRHREQQEEREREPSSG